MSEFGTEIPVNGSAPKLLRTLFADVIAQLPIRKLSDEFVSIVSSMYNSMPNSDAYRVRYGHSEMMRLELSSTLTRVIG
jgi:hypothetical protein